MQFFNVMIGQPYGSQESSEHLLNILLKRIKWLSLELIDIPWLQSSDNFRFINMFFHQMLIQMEAAVMKHHQSLFFGKPMQQAMWPAWLFPWRLQLWNKNGKQPALRSLQ